ncbi:MAG TPA: histidine phosphatase family protein [Gammaproteobacteria bacterium]|nr:histidine phosphatase family protein [Gammaproteobacteria bacterium]
MERTVDLLRHGEPEGGRKYRGQTDDPLTARGWSQMWTAVGEARPWDRIVTSPLLRCGEFADTLGAAMGLAVERDERLVEVGYGAWAGKSPEQLKAEDPEGFAAFRADPWRSRPADAEPMERFTERVLTAYSEHLAGGGEHLLFVAHAGVIRTVMAHTLGMPLENLYRLHLPYAGRVRLHTSHERTRISHMAPAPPGN